MDRKELINIRVDLIKRNFHPDATPVLVAVTKKQPVSDIEFAYSSGIRDFGENRIEELVEKSEALKHLDDIRWHYIGNIQSKKITKLFSVKGLYAIHSVDSFETLQNLIKKDENLNHPVQLFLQVNTSSEKEKSGFLDWDHLAASVNLLRKKEERFPLLGLMTMSKVRTNSFEEDARKCFEQLVKIKNRVEGDFDLESLLLSMGMSNDYEIALEVGTDFVRLGSSIFAPENRGP